MRGPSVGNAGPPITELWAWVVTDEEGMQAMCRSPFSPTATLVSPDREAIENLGGWCHDYYLPFKVAFCRFNLAEVIPYAG